MARAKEIFTTQLARTAGNAANRFLYSKGLQKSDRDDVISAALLWCWVNRDNFSLTTTLETWFMNAVRDAYKDLKRRALPSAEESLDALSGGDYTYGIAAAESSAEALIKALTPIDREIVQLKAEGYTYREISKRGYSHDDIDNAQQRVKQLRKLSLADNDSNHRPNSMSPSKSTWRMTRRDAEAAGFLEGRTPRTPNLDELDAHANFDLDRPPPAGKECAPCIHCNWWEFSYSPANNPQVMATADKEVLEAQRAILKRKIEISASVERHHA